MDKIVYLRNYADEKIKKSIPNWEDIKHIIVVVLSGDETLEITYYNHEPSTFDSDEDDDRMGDWCDGAYLLPVELVDKFSEFEGSSYECMEYIMGISK